MNHKIWKYDDFEATDGSPCEADGYGRYHSRVAFVLKDASGNSWSEFLESAGLHIRQGLHLCDVKNQGHSWRLELIKGDQYQLWYKENL